MRHWRYLVVHCKLSEAGHLETSHRESASHPSCRSEGPETHRHYSRVGQQGVRNPPNFRAGGTSADGRCHRPTPSTILRANRPPGRKGINRTPPSRLGRPDGGVNPTLRVHSNAALKFTPWSSNYEAGSPVLASDQSLGTSGRMSSRSDFIRPRSGTRCARRVGCALSVALLPTLVPFFGRRPCRSTVTQCHRGCATCSRSSRKMIAEYKTCSATEK